MTQMRIAIVGVCAVLLVACGGGDDGGEASVDIDGAWETVWGSSPTGATFETDGNDVTGTHDYYDDGKFVGTLEGNVLTGYWSGGNWASCDEEKEGTTSWGRIEFTFTDDSFDGKWTNCEAPIDEGSSAWTGTRAGTAQDAEEDETEGEDENEATDEQKEEAEAILQQALIADETVKKLEAEGFCTPEDAELAPSRQCMSDERVYLVMGLQNDADDEVLQFLANLIGETNKNLGECPEGTTFAQVRSGKAGVFTASLTDSEPGTKQADLDEYDRIIETIGGFVVSATC